MKDATPDQRLAAYRRQRRAPSRSNFEWELVRICELLQRERDESKMLANTYRDYLRESRHEQQTPLRTEVPALP